MPGRLVMDQHAVQGPDSHKKHLDQPLPQINGFQDKPSTDGPRHSDNAPTTSNLVNGTAPTPDAAVMNGSLLPKPDNANAKDGDSDHDRLPPELASWSHTYVPMGKMLERVAQQCFSDLNDVVDNLADQPVQPATSTTNGSGNHLGPISTPDTSQVSVEKKLRLMNFAQEQKDRFLKVSVLSHWARNMPDMDRLIELRMWLQEQDAASQQVADAIIRMKHSMVHAKMPNPNIRGALELLSTAKAPWMPDLGYVPPKQLDARQLVRTLKAMNFALANRLNLHEDLPPHFRTYTISNGRATFVVANEFEVDLAVVDEEDDSPFYFIDLRLLFSKAPLIADGVARANIEGKVNEVLASDGLSGCYRFLHDFVLTHRTNLLRRQAFEMARGKWNECLRVETIHRDFVIHYWTGQPGDKSWIQVGTLSTSKTRNPQLGIRWVREGEDSSEVEAMLQDPTQTMEQVLETVIASHIRWRLTKIANSLASLSSGSSALDIKLEDSSGSCSLKTQFGQSRTRLTLSISTVTGNVAISPATPIALTAVDQINAGPNVDAAQVLADLQCKFVQDQIRKHAQRLGWLPVSLVKQENLRRIFGDDVIRWSVFRPSTWRTECAVALSISLRGEKWWIVNMQYAPNALTGIISSAEAIPLDATSNNVDRAGLIAIEAKALALVSFANVTGQLRKRNIQYRLEPAGHTTISALESTGQAASTAVLYINFNDLMRPRDEPAAKTWKPWCSELITLTHHGIDETSATGESLVTHVLKGTLTAQAATSLAKLGNGNDELDKDMRFSKTGKCALRLRTRFGEGLVDLLEARLKLVDRIKNYIRLAHRAKVQLTYTGVTRLVFQYYSEPQLSAELIFSGQSHTVRELRLHASGAGQAAANANPHRRILPLLQTMIRGPVDDEADEREQYRRFWHLLRILDLTLPPVRQLCALEQAGASDISVRGTSYAYDHHRVAYSKPLAEVAFDMTLKSKDGRAVWVVTVAHSPGDKSKEVREALQKVWSSSGEGWSGLTTGAFAEKNGIEGLLARLDAAVREVSMPDSLAADDGKNKKKNDDREVVVLD